MLDNANPLIHEKTTPRSRVLTSSDFDNDVRNVFYLIAGCDTPFRYSYPILLPLGKTTGIVIPITPLPRGSAALSGSG